MCSSDLTIASPFFGTIVTPRHVPDRWSPEFWYRILVSVVLVLAGGVFAGYVGVGRFIYTFN